MPVIWTGVYPQMPIITQRWLTRRIVVNGQFVTPGLRLSNAFHFLALGANPWAKVHQNRSWPATHPGLPSC